MRYLAIDLGEKRTGIATGDVITGLVQPRVVIQQSKGEELLRRLAVEIEDFGPTRIVIGLPLNMDGSEGPARRRRSGSSATRSPPGPRSQSITKTSG
jgi:putative Holliday junction resolvase